MAERGDCRNVSQQGAVAASPLVGAFCRRAEMEENERKGLHFSGKLSIVSLEISFVENEHKEKIPWQNLLS